MRLRRRRRPEPRVPREVLVTVPSSVADPPGTVTLLYDGWMEIRYIPKPKKLYR